MSKADENKADNAKPKKQMASEEVMVLEQQIIDLTDALQRERADSMNLRRRYDEQIAGLAPLIRANVIKELLPVVDNFERSLKHVPKELKDVEYISGIQGIVRQFEKVLESLGVEKITSIGQMFDPKYHEAVSMEEGEGSHEIVSEELQSGYKLGDNVIRHAMVKVKMGELK